ncbi:MAG: cell wall hydrolase [Sphingomicrobium sp.]
MSPTRMILERLQNSSHGEHVSTRISGQSSWISRTRNGSSLKSSTKVDSQPERVKDGSTTRAGGSSIRKKSDPATRDGGWFRGEIRQQTEAFDARQFEPSTALITVFMTISLRSAIVFGAALAATGFAPAQAGSGQVQPQMIATATIPKVTVPDLLVLEDEPQLSGASAPALVIDQQPSITPQTEEAPTIVVRSAADLSSMISQLSTSEAGSREIECLATGVYFESKSEPLVGQLAVGHVISNRAKSGRFPSSYCGVLFQRGQFSFVHGKSLPSVPRSSKQWKTAVAIAKIVDQGLKDSSVGKAMFFHARYVSPGWRLKRVASIGNHIFYR